MMTGGHCLYDGHFSIFKKRTVGFNPPKAYSLYTCDNDENYGRPLTGFDLPGVGTLHR